MVKQKFKVFHADWVRGQGVELVMEHGSGLLYRLNVNGPGATLAYMSPDGRWIVTNVRRGRRKGSAGDQHWW